MVGNQPRFYRQKLGSLNLLEGSRVGNRIAPSCAAHYPRQMIAGKRCLLTAKANRGPALWPLILLCLIPAGQAAEVNCTVSSFKRDCKEPLLEPHKDESRKSITLKGVTITRELRQPADKLPSAAHCEVDFEVSYLQMHDRLRVETTIQNHACSASSGAYTLQVRTYVDADNGPEPVTRLFTEYWRREDDQAVQVKAFYPMENATRLGWVRVKSDPASACICVDQDANSNDPVRLP